MSCTFEGGDARTLNTLATPLDRTTNSVISTCVSGQKPCHIARAFDARCLAVPDVVSVKTAVTTTLVPVIDRAVAASRADTTRRGRTRTFLAGRRRIHCGVALELGTTLASYSVPVPDIHASCPDRWTAVFGAPIRTSSLHTCQRIPVRCYIRCPKVSIVTTACVSVVRCSVRARRPLRTRSRGTELFCADRGLVERRVALERSVACATNAGNVLIFNASTRRPNTTRIGKREPRIAAGSL